jgi:hypothetical protein
MLLYADDFGYGMELIIDGLEGGGARRRAEDVDGPFSASGRVADCSQWCLAMDTSGYRRPPDRLGKGQQVAVRVAGGQKGQAPGNAAVTVSNLGAVGNWDVARTVEGGR